MYEKCVPLLLFLLVYVGFIVCDLFVKLFLSFFGEETYISNITSFPALSVFMFTNV